mmetsp:Transcript_7962/g.15853  ORF Transcript_7962/g.15853 Transcript_7962/m.15853 type:complete len:209 (-) Transcript_7962:630-1256(-)
MHVSRLEASPAFGGLAGALLVILPQQSHRLLLGGSITPPILAALASFGVGGGGSSGAEGGGEGGSFRVRDVAFRARTAEEQRVGGVGAITDQSVIQNGTHVIMFGGGVIADDQLEGSSLSRAPREWLLFPAIIQASAPAADRARTRSGTCDAFAEFGGDDTTPSPSLSVCLLSSSRLESPPLLRWSVLLPPAFRHQRWNARHWGGTND